jgi:hypothetical protein
MADFALSTTKLDDATVIRLFREITSKFNPHDVGASSVAMKATINLRSEQPKDVIQLLDNTNSFVLNSANAQFRNFSVRWERGGKAKNNPWFDEIVFDQLVSNREQKFSLTKNTRGLRAPIHVAMGILIVFLLGANGWYVREVAQIDLSQAVFAVAAWLLIRQGLLILALVGAILYYVRWMNRWFEDHADAEFRLKQFQLDIDRASWVVETALEWRRLENSEIPAPLLEGITRNLFSNPDLTANDQTAVDDLASALVGNASAVRVKLGENEISLDRKGIKALEKTVENGR